MTDITQKISRKKFFVGAAAVTGAAIVCIENTYWSTHCC
jgi:hypothetical protein